MSACPARVLVVDDSEDDASIVSTLLRRAGYVVETAEDGERALSAIDRFAPDVMLLDLHMPELDGFGVLERLEERSKGASLVVEANTPLVIVVSASAEPSSVVRALEHGATDYVTKPYAQPILLARLAAVVRSRRERASLWRLGEDLRKAQEELARARRGAAIGAIAAGLAHEINNPAAFVVADLHEIRELSLELRESSESSEASRGEALASLCDESLEGMNRIRDVVHDLSVFASLVDERAQPPGAAVDVAKILRRRVDRTSSSITLRIHEGSPLRTAPRAGGEAEVEALIGLLIRHALEGATDATRVDVSLGAAPDGLVMTVERRHTTEVRAKATEPPVSHGIEGLALTIVSELAERLGCALDIESSRRGTARYALTLPLAE